MDTVQYVNKCNETEWLIPLLNMVMVFQSIWTRYKNMIQAHYILLSVHKYGQEKLHLDRSPTYFMTAILKIYKLYTSNLLFNTKVKDI